MKFELNKNTNPELVARGPNINSASKPSHNFRNLYSRDTSHNTGSIHFPAIGKSTWSLFCDVVLESTNRKGYNDTREHS